MPIMGVAKFERFFRLAAGLDVDKADLKRFGDFVHRKLHDLLTRAEAMAKANGRDIIEPFDLPITAGLQQRIHEFQRLDEHIALEPIIEALAVLPPLDLGVGEETEARLPEVAGGLGVALARTFKAIDPGVKNPTTQEWDRATAVFDLLL